MKKNMLITVFAIAVVLLAVILWRKNNVAQSPQSNLSENISADMLQEKCSALAKQYVTVQQNTLYAEFQKDATYTAHYNKTLGQCFALIENPYLDKYDGQVKSTVLTNPTIGGFLAVCSITEKNPKNTSCHYNNNSTTEPYDIQKFNNFVKPYMNN